MRKTADIFFSLPIHEKLGTKVKFFFEFQIIFHDKSGQRRFSTYLSIKNNSFTLPINGYLPTEKSLFSGIVHSFLTRYLCSVKFKANEKDFYPYGARACAFAGGLGANRQYRKNRYRMGCVSEIPLRQLRRNAVSTHELRRKPIQCSAPYLLDQKSPVLK